jgi:hypothetical protein
MQIHFFFKIKLGGEIRKSNTDEYDQSTLYAYMEISQWNPFVQLIYANEKLEAGTSG